MLPLRHVLTDPQCREQVQTSETDNRPGDKNTKIQLKMTLRTKYDGSSSLYLSHSLGHLVFLGQETRGIVTYRVVKRYSIPVLVKSRHDVERVETTGYVGNDP